VGDGGGMVEGRQGKGKERKGSGGGITYLVIGTQRVPIHHLAAQTQVAAPAPPAPLCPARHADRHPEDEAFVKDGVEALVPVDGEMVL